MNLNRLVATSLLLGYVMLVPFCFFGGAMLANMSTMDMSGNPVQSMNDCGMLAVGCAGSTETDAMGMIAHHVGMYLSISQTPLVALLSIMMIIVSTLLLVFVVIHRLTTELFMQSSLRTLARRVDEPQSRTRQTVITWLSLLEASPNFA